LDFFRIGRGDATDDSTAVDVGTSGERRFVDVLG